MRELYEKFEDFTKRVSESKEFGEIYFQPMTKMEWEDRPIPNGAIRVPRTIAFIRLTAMGTQRHLSYVESLFNDVIENDETKMKEANDKITAGIKTIIERLQDKCPKCRLFQGAIE